jgi:hypothetical protein
MLDSGVIDVAIGVLLVYLLISLICSAINEVVASRLRLRSKDLEDGIRTLLGGEPAYGKKKSLQQFWLDIAKNIVLVPWNIVTGSDNGSGNTGEDVAGRFFSHPLIRSLRHNDKLPSYLPPRTFSAALLDTLNSKDFLAEFQARVAALTNGPLKEYLTVLLEERDLDPASPRWAAILGDATIPEDVRTALTEALTIADVSAAKELVKLLAKNLAAVAMALLKDRNVDPASPGWVAFLGGASIPQDVRTALTEALTRADVSAAKELVQQLAENHAAVAKALLAPPEVQSMLRLIDELPDGSPLKMPAREAVSGWLSVLQNVQALIHGLEGEVDRQRMEIESWFDQSMDRVSGWYKRRAQLILVVIAIPIVAALNADTITMAQTLWQDATVRQVLVSEATGLVNQDSTPACFAPQEQAAAGEDQPDPEDCVDQLRTQLKGLEILGWRSNDSDEPEALQRSDPREIPEGFLNWLLKIGGMALTVGAVSQGSQFWFDLLKKAVNLRGAGKAPPSSTDPVKK